MPSNNEIRTEITQTIVGTIEAGGLPPWRKSWSSSPNFGFPTNAATGNRYSGANVILCLMAAMRFGFESNHFATYKQWQQLGGQVRKRPSNVPAGHWGTRLVFAKPIKKKRTDSDGNDVEDKFFILKPFTVFNVDQVDGNFDHLQSSTSADTRNDFECLEHAEAVFNATNADVRFGGDRCFYSPTTDHIQMPNPEQFDFAYYESLSHEFIHWTLNERRLNWKPTTATQYAEEELVAEIGACFLSLELGISVTDDLSNHCSYLDSWLSRMKEDAGFLFRASSAASKAVDHVLNYSKTEMTAETHN